MNNIYDTPPEMFAFPKSGTFQLGITMRDYFAAKAMQALIERGINVETAAEQRKKNDKI